MTTETLQSLERRVAELEAKNGRLLGLLGMAHLNLRQHLTYGFNPLTAKSTLISVGQDAPELRQAIAEAEREKQIHERHCNQGEWVGVCKYSDPNCPAIATEESSATQEPVSVKHMMEWVAFLKARSDNGQHKQIPSNLSAGACWDLAVELEQFINTHPQPKASATQEPVAWPEFVERACGLIKAADDAAADRDYMLDSDDCISVLRGTWKGNYLNDQPQPYKALSDHMLQATNGAARIDPVTGDFGVGSIDSGGETGSSDESIQFVDRITVDASAPIEFTIPKEQFDLMLTKANVELIQRVNKLIESLPRM